VPAPPRPRQQAALGLALRVDGDLREVDFGMAEGHRLTDLDPALAMAFRHDPVAGAFPGAEDPRSAAERGVGPLRRIATRHPDGRTLVVAHNTLLRLVLCSLLGVPLSRYRAVFPQVRNCALTEVRLGRSSAALLAYNVPLPGDPS
jgi:probable phosphoglycerate mutase